MTEPSTAQTREDGRPTRFLLTWVLAVLTVPAAVGVFLYAMGVVMGMAGCTNDACANRGPSEFWFGILFYGAPVIPVAVIALSIFTARLKWGIWVPVIGLALLAIDFVALAVSF